MAITNADQLRILYGYHHWATDRVLDALAPATAEQLDRRWGGSFGTGRALLRHVVGVEWPWCERWNGRSPRNIPEFPTSASGGDFRAAWKPIKDDQRSFVNGVTPSRLTGDLTYINIKGETWTYRLGEILQHVVNHGTYHRGQLTHLLRDLALPAPSTDYLIFVEEQRAR